MITEAAITVHVHGDLRNDRISHLARKLEELAKEITKHEGTMNCGNTIVVKTIRFRLEDG